MKKARTVYTSIDQYISSFPDHIQRKLKEMRAIIKDIVPEAKEKISYQMPTFYLNGNLVHFAGYSGHIGFYPTPGGIDAFKNEISKYKYAKGSVQFSIDEPLPVELIVKIVKFRAEENRSKRH